MTLYRLDRPSGIPLEFEGTLLAEIDSRQESVRGRRTTDRWTEIRIWRVAAGNIMWVTDWTGGTKVAGEEPRIRIETHSTPAGVRTALLHPQSGVLTRIAVKALREAAEADDHLRPALVESL